MAFGVTSTSSSSSIYAIASSRLSVIGVVKRDLKGLQTGFFNGSKNVTGAQVGIFNMATEVEGIQIGLVNKASMMRGVQIGLINAITEKDDLAILPIVNWNF